MKKHVAIYLKHFNYTIADFIPCEVCGKRAVDVHHIECRGLGGSKEKDTIDNLQALCRLCHVLYGDKKDEMEMLKRKHRYKLMGYNMPE